MKLMCCQLSMIILPPPWLPVIFALLNITVFHKWPFQWIQFTWQYFYKMWAAWFVLFVVFAVISFFGCFVDVVCCILEIVAYVVIILCCIISSALQLNWIVFFTLRRHTHTHTRHTGFEVNICNRYVILFSDVHAGRFWVVVSSLWSQCAVSVSEEFSASTRAVWGCGVVFCGTQWTVQLWVSRPADQMLLCTGRFVSDATLSSRLCPYKLWTLVLSAVAYT